MKTFFDEIQIKNKLFLNLEEIVWLPENLIQFKQFLELEYNFDLSKPWYLFLDEVQVLQNPETFVKMLYDSPEVKAKLIVSGSRFWWEKKVWSSLIGRWYFINVWPFDLEEFMKIKGKKLINTSWNLIWKYVEEYLAFGWYPKVVLAVSKQTKLQELERIVDRFFEKDFVYFFEKGELINFKKVFQFLALNLKNIVKYDALATQLSISRYKVQKFIKFLEDSFLIWQVPPFFTDKAKEFSAHSKFYFVDTGILNYVRWNFDISLDKGWVVENFVFTHLRRKFKEIFYYHTQKGSEIDFIVSFFDENLQKKVIPIEAKASDRVKIPKIFYSFYNRYKDLIKYFVVTTKDFEGEKNIENMKVKFAKFRWFWKEMGETLKQNLPSH